MRKFKKHVAVDLDQLAVFAQPLFRELKLIIRSHEFNRARGHPLFRRGVELKNFGFRPLPVLRSAITPYARLFAKSVYCSIVLSVKASVSAA